MRGTGVDGQPSPQVSHMVSSPTSLDAALFPDLLASAFQLSETYLMGGRPRKGRHESVRMGIAGQVFRMRHHAGGCGTVLYRRMTSPGTGTTRGWSWPGRVPSLASDRTRFAAISPIRLSGSRTVVSGG
jgi:hypothetical protein